MNMIVIEEDCYYMTCIKGASCPDSRELGYFTHKDFIGRYMEWPDQIKVKVIYPIQRYANRAIDYALSLLAPDEESEEATNTNE